jgi:hypothetical protein
MRLPIQAKPIIRNVNTARILDVGIVSRGDCCHCRYLPNALLTFDCFGLCCGNDTGANCCESFVHGNWGPRGGDRGKGKI